MQAMKPMEIARAALRTLWTHKHLWFFGFFVAAAGGGGGGGGGAGPASEDGAAALPGWLLPAIAAAVLVGLLGLVMHLLSEGALIEGVRRGRDGARLGIRSGLREGRRHLWTLAGIKLAMLGLAVLIVAAVALPALLGAFGVIPTAAGIAVAVPLGLVAIPAMLTVYFVYQYAMRFAVLEDRTAGEALRQGRRFLHGRLAPSLQLTVVSFLGQVGGGVVSALALLPAAAVGFAVYGAAGLAPAIAAGATLAVLVVVPITGAIGTYRSSVWTHGFLEQRR